MAKRTTDPTWLTRPQVAALAATTEDDILALDGKELRPVRDGDRSWRYDPAEVAALLRRRSGVAADAGEITAQAFEMFRADKNDVDVVIATRRVAAEVRALRSEYDEMSGALTIPASGAAKLRQLVGADAATKAAAVADLVERELAIRYENGYREGQEESEGLGELVNPRTGERRTVRGPTRERSGNS